ncbi:MAG: hypothetical protein ACK5X3_22220, partial [Pseudomonadota bacterium]
MRPAPTVPVAQQRVVAVGRPWHDECASRNQTPTLIPSERDASEAQYAGDGKAPDSLSYSSIR